MMVSDEITQPSTSSNASSQVKGSPEAPQFKVFNPPASTAPSPKLDDLPDEYFEFTKTELKLAFDSQRKLRESLQNAPLKTQAMRHTEEKKKLQRWPYTTLRIKFPDQTILEKVFDSSEKIKAVYVFVRGSLREDMKPNKFVLYQTPPRREFKVSDPDVRDLSLAQLLLAPSSILYLSFLEANLNDPSIRAPLAEEVLRLAEDLPTPPKVDPPPTSPVPKPSSGNQKGGQDSSGEKKTPKWLKLYKK